MDTVYLRGMLAQQPLRIDGNHAYGLGISDDKHGIAVILHSLAILRQMNFHDYGELTVLIVTGGAKPTKVGDEKSWLAWL